MSRYLNIANPLKEKLLFFRRWIENPYRMGAVLPSSKTFAQLIAQNILWENRQENEYVVEIGAGTGSVTKMLLDMGFPPNRLICVEVDQELYKYLKERFPRVMVLWGNACNLHTLLPKSIHGSVSTVMSGIPMVTATSVAQKEIIDGCFDVLKPGGKMLQFTYSPFSSVRSRNHRLKQRRIGTVFRNFPPATVWCYERIGISEQS